jgi:hypothetical protein
MGEKSDVSNLIIKLTPYQNKRDDSFSQFYRRPSSKSGGRSRGAEKLIMYQAFLPSMLAAHWRVLPSPKYDEQSSRGLYNAVDDYYDLTCLIQDH